MKYELNPKPFGPLYITDYDSFLIKLNKKCKKGTVDDTNKCNLEESNKTSTDISKFEDLSDDEVLERAQSEAEESGLEGEEFVSFIDQYVVDYDKERKRVESIRASHLKVPDRNISIPASIKSDKTKTNILKRGISLLAKPIDKLPMGRELQDFVVNSKLVSNKLIKNPNFNPSYIDITPDLNKLMKNNPNWTSEYAFNELIGYYGNTYINKDSLKEYSDIVTDNSIYAMDHYINQSKIEGPLTVYSGIDSKYAKSIPTKGNFKTKTFTSTSMNKEIATEFSNRQSNDKEKYVLEIKLQKGDNALSMHGFYSKNIAPDKFDIGSGERNMTDVQEVVLPRRKDFQVIGRRKENNITIITLKSLL